MRPNVSYADLCHNGKAANRLTVDIPCDVGLSLVPNVAPRIVPAVLLKKRMNRGPTQLGTPEPQGCFFRGSFCPHLYVGFVPLDERGHVGRIPFVPLHSIRSVAHDDGGGGPVFVEPQGVAEVYLNLSFCHAWVLQRPGVKEKEEVVDMIKTAANVVEWVSHPEFLGLEHPLWPVQLNFLVDLFQEECWPCSEREAEQWEGDLEDSPSILFQYGVCPNCGREKSKVHPTPIREGVGAWGQRTGKGWTTVVAATYQLHRALSRGHLSHYYGLASPTVFDFTFVDPSKKYLWQLFLQMWDRSPWAQMFDAAVPKTTTDDEVTYPIQQVRIKVLGKGDSGRGGTGLFGAIDSYDWSKSYKINGPEVRRALLNSFTTVNTRLPSLKIPNPLDPKLVLLDTPNWDSKELQLLCQKQSSSRVVSRHPAWRVNPETSKSELLGECGGATDRFRRDFAAEFSTPRR